MPCDKFTDVKAFKATLALNTLCAEFSIFTVNPLVHKLNDTAELQILINPLRTNINLNLFFIVPNHALHYTLKH
jgi:hypothetical protein